MLIKKTPVEHSWDRVPLKVKLTYFSGHASRFSQISKGKKSDHSIFVFYSTLYSIVDVFRKKIKGLQYKCWNEN